GARLDLPAEQFLSPNIDGHERLRIPSYSFLITHPSKGRVLFDLSLRKDFQNLAPVMTNLWGGEWKCLRTCPTYWSRMELNYTKSNRYFGLINTLIILGIHPNFPATRSWLSGRDSRRHIPTPGYPDNPESPVKSADLKGRRVNELDFDNSKESISIGRFKAFDWFEDGSFYLLDVPGHSAGLICGFARVKPDSFILMGGDCAHHPGEFRPSNIAPVPKDLIPLHVAVHAKQASVCPGSITEKINKKSDIERSPIYKAAAMFTHDIDKCQWSIQGIQELDACQNVLEIIAHDGGILPVLQQANGKESSFLFPKGELTEWQHNEFKEAVKWVFLSDLAILF
ncbi:hypothetical protein N7537_003424, partial [Penicillium hordei]